jgi:hypothetical protein
VGHDRQAIASPSSNASYAAFVEEAWARHLRLAILLSGDRHRAEDLLQDCLVKLYFRWKHSRSGDPHAYLRRMLVNGNVSRWRRTRKETLTDQIPDRADPLAEASEPHEQLRSALMALSPRQREDALVLAPSHQWPVGGALPAARRAAVLRWAREQDTVVIEDDYDAEYRFDRSPLGALQGLAPDQVVYAGTLSKTLAPGVRIGWLVLPTHLAEAVATAKITADRGSATVEQLAFADFVDRGEFDRHTRRIRPIYRARREALLAALRRHLPDARPAGIAAGLHILVWLPPDLDDQSVAAAAAELGVFVQPLTPYRLTPRPGLPGGLVLGYSVLTEHAIADGVALLAQAITRLRTTAERATGRT